MTQFNLFTKGMLEFMSWVIFLARDRCLRWQFNIGERETTGYFLGKIPLFQTVFQP